MQIKSQMVEEAMPLVDTLVKNWLLIRQQMQWATGEQPISREQDQGFLQMKSVVSRCYSQIRNRMPAQLCGSHERFQDMMKQALSVTHMRNLPPTDQRQAYALWHGFYLDLCRLHGALKFMMAEQYFPNIEDKKQKASGNIKESIVADSKKKK